MAGIGFELRRLSRSHSYAGLLRAYIYAGLIGSGPWVLSIFAILILGFLSLGVVIPPSLIGQFQVTVTWLIAVSLIYTGAVQLGFTRYTADCLFKREPERVVPNLNGLLLVVLVPGFILAVLATRFIAFDTSLAYRLLFIAGFGLLCAVWILTVLLSGLKRHRSLLALYGIGYGAILGLGLLLRPLKLDGLVLAFDAGQFLLLLGMLILIWRHYPSSHLLEFDFLRPANIRPLVLLTGLFFNLGIWADKFVFWLWPATSKTVIGALRASPIYDTPIFLAYFAIIPGMAVFLLRMEVDFVAAYDRYYEAVRNGGALSTIRDYRARMIATAREGIYDIFKVQGITLLLVAVVSDRLLGAFGISTLYASLFRIDTLGVSLQVVLMATLNIMFYLDKQRAAAGITGLLVIANISLSLFTLHLGPFYFGYGFALAMLIASVAALVLADRQLERLDYETFMLR